MLLEAVGEPVDERGFRADDHEVDAELLGECRDRVDVARGDLLVALGAEVGDAGVAGGRV